MLITNSCRDTHVSMSRHDLRISPSGLSLVKTRSIILNAHVATWELLGRDLFRQKSFHVSLALLTPVFHLWFYFGLQLILCLPENMGTSIFAKASEELNKLYENNNIKALNSSKCNLNTFSSHNTIIMHFDSKCMQFHHKIPQKTI